MVYLRPRYIRIEQIGGGAKPGKPGLSVKKKGCLYSLLSSFPLISITVLHATEAWKTESGIHSAKLKEFSPVHFAAPLIPVSLLLLLWFLCCWRVVESFTFFTTT